MEKPMTKRPPVKKVASLKKKDKLPSWYKKQCDILFSHYIRRKGYCEWCGRSDVQLQCSHIIPRTNFPMRCNEYNALCLCAICHLFKWHKHPLYTAEWFNTTWPGRWEYLKGVEDQTLGVSIVWKEEWQRLKILTGVA